MRAPFRSSLVAACAVFVSSLAACDRGATTSTSLESWCVQLELARRERHVACGCAGEPATDEAIGERCDALDAASLRRALVDGDLLWNGALATSILRRVPEVCEHRAEVVDDPLIGNVPVGEPCRVFADVAGQPSDCVLGARCAAPLGGGEARCASAGCANDDDCLGRACADGICSMPVCDGP